MSGSAFIYDPTLSQYQLSESHPFKPLRLELTRSLLQATGLLTSVHDAELKPISEKELHWHHRADYIRMVQAVSRGENLSEAYAYGLGTGDNPIFPQMHEAIMRVCAATVSAVDLVASGQKQRALNLSGGLHHAQHANASGFCVYNDLAIGIEHAVQNYGMRVAYIDIDAHHGDGVQWLFYDRAEVLTISLHESGRYLFPGTGHTYEVGKEAGRGLSINMPLEPFTEDSSYLEAVRDVIPVYLRRFKPDLILLQAGADMHRYDPLANLCLSVQGMAESYQLISDLADEVCEGRLVATGGGGYDPYRTVPRAWALLWAALSRQELPDMIPEGWLSQWQELSPVELPERVADDLQNWSEIPRRKDIESHNRATIRRLHSSLEPIWHDYATMPQ